MHSPIYQSNIDPDLWFTQPRKQYDVISNFLIYLSIYLFIGQRLRSLDLREPTRLQSLLSEVWTFPICFPCVRSHLGIFVLSTFATTRPDLNKYCSILEVVIIGFRAVGQFL